MPSWRRRDEKDERSGNRPEDRDRTDIFDDPFFEMRSDIFRDFDDQFRRMRSYMDAMMERAASGSLKGTDEGGPFVYGWSMRVGPDGVPHVQTFGNVGPQAMRGARALGPADALPGAEPDGGGEGGEDDGEDIEEGEAGASGRACSPEGMVMPGIREPLTDICEGEKEITVTAEMPGIEKDNIELETGDDFLVIRVEKGNRRFYKELPLRTRVVPDSARAKYNNGVLEVTVVMAPAEKKGTKVKVE